MGRYPVESCSVLQHEGRSVEDIFGCGACLFSNRSIFVGSGAFQVRSFGYG